MHMLLLSIDLGILNKNFSLLTIYTFCSAWRRFTWNGLVWPSSTSKETRIRFSSLGLMQFNMWCHASRTMISQFVSNPSTALKQCCLSQELNWELLYHRWRDRAVDLTAKDFRPFFPIYCSKLPLKVLVVFHQKLPNLQPKQLETSATAVIHHILHQRSSQLWGR